jgi:hypothetical protein
MGDAMCLALAAADRHDEKADHGGEAAAFLLSDACIESYCISNR